MADTECYQIFYDYYHDNDHIIVKNIDQNKLLRQGKPSKRCALVEGLKYVDKEIPIVVFADDDVHWSPKLLETCLIAFNNTKVVACGPNQYVKPKERKFTLAEVMSDMRLFTRFVEVKATVTVCNNVSCISGRTALYRKELFNRDRASFEKFFLKDKFADFIQNSGDDKCLARWVYKQKNAYFAIQDSKDCYLSSEFPEWKGFIKQIIRWGQNTWKSDIKSIRHTYVWKKAFWLCVIMFDRMLSPFFLLIGHTLGYYILLTNFKMEVFLLWFLWIIGTRFLKLFGYFVKYPFDIIYLPFYIIFTYVTACLKLYSLLTINKKPNWLTK